ncbi:EMYY motif lipoprotein [Salinicoccus halitifaciens]|uniref:EMYY motif lipoprotein n=1 Tax=Salinicoccus halitifaciens TaxID=1073415 RepID=A0ABV2EBN5_9STAP|nr:EMYY motif lipoprotein [Salinicoccus halitifaciens]MCD2138872.1 EMYY motif lipoprotein [Salinicoccus halitifaciens]
MNKDVKHVKAGPKGTFTLLLICTFILSACGDPFAQEMENYQEQMDGVHKMNEEVTRGLDNIDGEEIIQHVSDIEAGAEDDEFEDLAAELESEILPLAETLEEEASAVETDREEIQEQHDIFLESAEAKADFTEQLSDYLITYQNSIEASERLIALSQSFMENQRERDDIIESAEDEEVVNEIDMLIEQLNENSEALYEASDMLESDEPMEKKQEQIDEVLLPMLDEHVTSLDTINLSTQQANRVRSISLEMYYGYQAYYEERKNTMLYNEKLQNIQLQNILSLQESYQKMDEEYRRGMEELKNGE